ncbi:MAG: superinfection exclusion B family protein [Desulfobulbaceae bacterium]|nr:superinfection exclusion B family protein [Desulfobulbaceae bacterium]
MADISALITKFFNLSLPAIATVFLASSFVLLSLDTNFHFLNFSNVREQGKFYLNTAFLLSFCFLFVKSIIFITTFIRKKHRNWLFGNALKSRLAALTPEEKSTLSTYIKKQTRSNMISIYDGVAEGLVRSGILYQSSDFGSMHELIFAYNINDFVWIYLNEHPKLVGLIKSSDGFINEPMENSRV